MIMARNVLYMVLTDVAVNEDIPAEYLQFHLAFHKVFSKHYNKEPLWLI